MPQDAPTSPRLGDLTNLNTTPYPNVKKAIDGQMVAMLMAII